MCTYTYIYSCLVAPAIIKRGGRIILRDKSISRFRALSRPRKTLIGVECIQSNEKTKNLADGSVPYQVGSTTNSPPADLGTETSAPGLLPSKEKDFL